MTGALILSVMALASIRPEMPPPDVVFSNLAVRAVSKLPQCLSQFQENSLRQNPDFWLKGVDFTCVSPWNDSYGRFRTGTAISKRHIIFAKHYPLAVGTRIAFVGDAGGTSHYSVKATRALADCDIMIGLLDYELTPDVHPAKVLPPGYRKWIGDGSTWPTVTYNRSRQALLGQTVFRSDDDDSGKFGLSRSWLNNEPLFRFAGRIVAGDSGNPAFMLYRGHPILLYCLQFGGSGHGPQIHRHRREIQRAMDDLCPGYRLEEFDFARSAE